MIQSGREDIRQISTLRDTIIQMNTKNKYGLRAHDLRSFIITKSTLEGITPFIILKLQDTQYLEYKI